MRRDNYKKNNKLIVVMIFIAIVILAFFSGKSITGYVMEDTSVDTSLQLSSLEDSYQEIDYHNRTLAKDWIDNVKEDIAELEDLGLGIVRMGDILGEAEQSYEAQKALEDNQGIPNFKFVKENINIIEGIKDEAIEVSDEFAALTFYMDSLDESLNLSEAEVLLLQAKEEFSKERYTDTFLLIEQTYDKISYIESMSTTSAVIYTAATQTVTNFLKKYWQTILITLAIIVLLIIILHKRISIYKIKLKIRKLELEKKVLNELIADSQFKYFEEKTIPKETFNVRTNKFKELIRDINRRIPMLKEEIEKKKSTRELRKVARDSKKALADTKKEEKKKLRLEKKDRKNNSKVKLKSKKKVGKDKTKPKKKKVKLTKSKLQKVNDDKKKIKFQKKNDKKKLILEGKARKKEFSFEEENQ